MRALVNPTPRVSVCLPVYNGQDYLQTAIDSVLRQTYTHLELIISDNASTDRTGEICREAAERDPRVRYVRASLNGGLAWNFNRAFELAGGRYVSWIGHDDVMEGGYIEKCVEVLERDAQSVVCFSYQNHIDEDGTLLRQFAFENDADAVRASERFRKLIRWTHPCAPIFGLMRREVLAQTHLHGGYADSDRVLLAELGLRGPFSLIPDYLFSIRVHSKRTTQHEDLRERSLVFDPSRAGTTFFPFVLKARGFRSGISRASLTGLERMRCYWHLWQWAHTHWFELRFDVREGLVLSLKRRLSAERFNRLKAVKKSLIG